MLVMEVIKGQNSMNIHEASLALTKETWNGGSYAGKLMRKISKMQTTPT